MKRRSRFYFTYLITGFTVLSAGSVRFSSLLLLPGDESAGKVIRVLVTLHLFLVMAPETSTTTA